jgi:hypothetical protein
VSLGIIVSLGAVLDTGVVVLMKKKAAREATEVKTDE